MLFGHDVLEGIVGEQPLSMTGISVLGLFARRGIDQAFRARSCSLDGREDLWRSSRSSIRQPGDDGRADTRSGSMPDEIFSPGLPSAARLLRGLGFASPKDDGSSDLACAAEQDIIDLDRQQAPGRSGSLPARRAGRKQSCSKASSRGRWMSRLHVRIVSRPFRKYGAITIWRIVGENGPG